MVPNAEVVVTSDETGVKQKTTTNLQGNWIAQFLIPGRYGFTVTAAGFKQAEASQLFPCPPRSSAKGTSHSPSLFNW